MLSPLLSLVIRLVLIRSTLFAVYFVWLCAVMSYFIFVNVFYLGCILPLLRFSFPAFLDSILLKGILMILYMVLKPRRLVSGIKDNNN